MVSLLGGIRLTSVGVYVPKVHTKEVQNETKFSYQDPKGVLSTGLIAFLL